MGDKPGIVIPTLDHFCARSLHGLCHGHLYGLEMGTLMTVHWIFVGYISKKTYRVTPYLKNAIRDGSYMPHIHLSDLSGLLGRASDHSKVSHLRATPQGGDMAYASSLTLGFRFL